MAVLGQLADILNTALQPKVPAPIINRVLVERLLQAPPTMPSVMPAPPPRVPSPFQQFLQQSLHVLQFNFPTAKDVPPPRVQQMHKPVPPPRVLHRPIPVRQYAPPVQTLPPKGTHRAVTPDPESQH